jgi:hypothetical protein
MARCFGCKTKKRKMVIFRLKKEKLKFAFLCVFLKNLSKQQKMHNFLGRKRFLSRNFLNWNGRILGLENIKV